MEIELAVFDMAGTTVVDNGVVNQAFQLSFLSEGITVPSTDIDMIMGYHKAQAIRMMLDKYYQGSGVDELVDMLLERFTSSLVDIYRSNAVIPQPFAEELFSSLRKSGLKVALNTGFTRKITDVILQKLHWDGNEVIDAVICSDEVSLGRPHPFMIRSLMERFNIKDPARVAKCGDTSVDIQEGRNAACGLVVGITTGAFTRAELLVYEPDAIIDNLKEFTSLLNQKHAGQNR